ncbi:MAG TPA: hypothetical protein VKB50_05735 [Vicinamibacterales bacterium]|nr:hypothetical protein [Vicinamibacterales bacterium]
MTWVAVALSMATTPLRAQGTSADPNLGNLKLTSGFDVTNAYLFRGIPQDDTGVIMWPYADLGITLHHGDGALGNVGVNVGMWNSLHTGLAGLDGLGKLWYESDFYTTLALGFGKGTSLGVTYTAYNSPNSGFVPVKEVSFKLAMDDSGPLGRYASKPYVIVARELEGQADAGTKEGTYLELGAAPSIGLGRVGVAVPLRLGLSLADYYEGANGDERFGFFSVAGVVTVPFSSRPTRFGSWNVHGGVEFVTLGDRNEAILGDRSKVIVSGGIGLSY